MASSTVSWKVSALHQATQTGSSEHFFNDLGTLVNGNAADPEFRWQVADSDVSSNPRYINLKRKDGSPGRLIYFSFTSTLSSGNANPVIFDPENHGASYIGCAFFPSGNVDTPNLTAMNSSSGVIMGDDSGAIPVTGFVSFGSFYNSTSVKLGYFESDEAFFVTRYVTDKSQYIWGGGNIVVDSSDNAWPAMMYADGDVDNFSSTSLMIPFINLSGNTSTSSGKEIVRARVNGTLGNYYQALAPTGWASMINGKTDSPLVNTETSNAYFFPCYLISPLKGVGLTLKLRQIAHGPPVDAGYESYEETPGTVSAVNMHAANVAAAGEPWLLNFKI